MLKSLAESLENLFLKYGEKFVNFELYKDILQSCVEIDYAWDQAVDYYDGYIVNGTSNVFVIRKETLAFPKQLEYRIKNSVTEEERTLRPLVDPRYNLGIKQKESPEVEREASNISIPLFAHARVTLRHAEFMLDEVNGISSGFGMLDKKYLIPMTLKKSD